MATLESKLIVSLLDRLTGPARGLTSTINRLTTASQANAARMAALRGRMMDAAGAGYVLYKGISAPVQAAMQFESAMADIRKVVTFETPQAFKQMGLDIRAMSRELPMAADQIAAIVAAAGQSGVATNELLKFTEMAAKIGVAWDTAAGETGQALAELRTALGYNLDQVGGLADAINHLGNNTAANAPNILKFTQRVAPLARQFGLTAEQASAFGAAMIGAGFNAEVASTSFQNMGLNLTKGASATGRQKAALKALGLSSMKVAKSMQTDAIGTITDVFARLRAVPDHMRAAMMSDIFGNEAKALAPLIGNAELLAKAIALVADETRYAGSANAEYLERSKTTDNAMQLFKNRINDLGISIGDALIPGLNALIGGIGPVITSVSELAQRFPMVTNAIVGVTAAVVGFRVAAIGAQFAGLFVKQAFLDVGIAALSASRSIGRIAFAPVVAGFNALRTAMIGYTAAAAVGGHGAALAAMGSGLLGLLNPLRLVTTAMRVLKVAVIGTGIGAVLVGIAAAGTWIYNNWTGISTAFEAFKGAFSRAVEPIMPAIQPVLDGFSWLYDKVAGLLGPVDELGGGWAAAGIAAGKFVGDTIVAIVQLPGKITEYLGQAIARLTAFGADMVAAGKALMNSLLEGIKAGAAAVLAYVTNIGSRIKNAITGAVSSAWQGAKNMVGLGSGESPAVAGARAAGGPVRAGVPYLVGERGPELVTFPHAGTVHDALRTARILRNAAIASAVSLPAAAAPALPSFAPQGDAPAQAQARSASQVNVDGITIHVQGAPGQSPQALAQEVKRVLSAELNALSRGSYSDGAD